MITRGLSSPPWGFSGQTACDTSTNRLLSCPRLPEGDSDVVVASDDEDEGPGNAAETAAAAANDAGDGGVWGPPGGFKDEEEEDLDASVGYNFTETMEPPAELLMPLLPYQKQFLAWAIKQEKGTVRGGILADEVGVCAVLGLISYLSCLVLIPVECASQVRADLLTDL